MLERILPPPAVVVETVGELEEELFPEERRALGDPVEKRRREFVTARACARRALAGLDLPAQAIPSGPRGEPLWPPGIVGSITHTSGYRACAVARAEELGAIGIDAELDRPLPEGLVGDIALPEERRSLAALAAADAGVSWDKLLFSIKESIYKAWFPLTGQRPGFEDARVAIDRRGGTFAARLSSSVPGPDGQPAVALAGSWLAASGLLLAATTIPADRDFWPQQGSP